MNSLILEKEQMLNIVRSAIQFGDFKLKDGTSSSFFVSGRTITGHPLALTFAAMQIMKHLDENGADAVAGEDTGATSIISALLVLAGLNGRPLKSTYIRKTSKSHGVEGLIDTPIQAGRKYVIVDDVSSSGDTLLRCLSLIRSQTADVILAITILDRERGAKEKLQEAGVSLVSLFSISEVMERIQR